MDYFRMVSGVMVLLCVIQPRQFDDDIKEQGNHCVCKPTMKLSWEGTPPVAPASHPGSQPICNNATFDWLLHNVLVEMSRQNDVIAAYEKELAELRASREKSERTGHDNLDETLVTTLTEENERLHVDIGYYQEENRRLKQQNLDLVEEVELLNEKNAKENPRPLDCADVQRYGFQYSGIYRVFGGRYDMEGMEVFCDLSTDHGGWTVIQRRQDGTQRFDRSWESYKWGFGKVTQEFYLGNQIIHHITNQREYELRVDITDLNGVTGHAFYSSFKIDSEDKKYTLHIGQYEGNAGDALSHHDNHPFSTKDVDNDQSRSGHCSQLYGSGGWWFVRCYDSNLNGVYTTDPDNKAGVIWYQWKNNQEPLRHVEMKIRPSSFRDQH